MNLLVMPGPAMPEITMSDRSASSVSASGQGTAQT
jgi:hypothetical protein